jgi:threonine/homoserine/homoserine lactone efflux protein
MLHALATIAVLHWAILLVPGFNFVLLSQLAAGGSRRAALAAVVGMTSGTLLWATLTVAGVGVVFTAHPALRLGAQVAGGLYLLQLAAALWRSGGVAEAASRAALGPAAALRTGFVTSVLNPKIVLFYGSVFATALPADPPAPLVAAAVAMVYVNSWVWHATLALALSQPAVQRAHRAHHRRVTRVSALLVGAFGLRLLLEAARAAADALGP